MKDDDIPDFTDNFTRIFKLAECVRKLRGAFLFAENDARSRRDKAFIAECLANEKKNEDETENSNSI